MSKRPHLYKATCRLYLLFDRVNSSFYRRFEELGNLGSRPVALVKSIPSSHGWIHPVSFS